VRKERWRERRRATRRAAGVVAIFATAALALAASGSATPHRSTAGVRVLAAASLTHVLPKIDPTPQYSFAGSDTLAEQIRLGAPADVFAAANTSLPEQLYAQRLVEKPVVFTTNKLVLVVPRANPAVIRSVFDLRRPGIKLVVGTATVPIGSYTRAILRNLALTSVLANVVSEETDVRSILGKVGLGEADAGFVYKTDAKTAADRLTVVPVPAWAQPPVRYAMAVVKSTQDRRAAVAFIDKVLARSGQAKLRAAGFGAVKNGAPS
jgi:molybdate transport system substrate-binding protein